MTELEKNIDLLLNKTNWESLNEVDVLILKIKADVNVLLKKVSDLEYQLSMVRG